MKKPALAGFLLKPQTNRDSPTGLATCGRPRLRLQAQPFEFHAQAFGLLLSVENKKARLRGLFY